MERKRLSPVLDGGGTITTRRKISDSGSVRRPKPKREVVPKVVEYMTDFATDKDICQFFRKTTVTIREWRESRGLPFVVIPGDGKNLIRYRLELVIPWATREKVRMFDLPPKIERILPEAEDPNDGLF